MHNNQKLSLLQANESTP